MPDTLALAALFGLVSGVSLGSLFAPPWALLCFAALVALLCAGAWFFGRRDAYLLPALFLLLLALGAGRALLARPALPDALASSLGTDATLSGVIVADPDMRETNQRIAVETGGTKVLAVADRYGSYAVGDRVTVEGTLELPQAFSTDGGRQFDYRMFLAKDGIVAVVPHAKLALAGRSRNPFLLTERALYAGKHAFGRALERALPEPYASLAEGLITGGKQGLGSALLAAFTVAGLLPIVVLSGYNVMIVADSVLAALAFLPRRAALLASALGVLLFVLAAGGGASALRAALMALLALYARASRRTYDALRALLAVFALMLLVSPLSLAYDPGFQFSFAAALGLIVLAAPLARHLAWLRPAWVLEIVATTLAAQLFVLPLLLYETGNLSLVALPANVLVLPFIPLSMGLSALAGAVSLLVPPLAPFAGLPAYAVLYAIVAAAEAFAKLPFAHLVVPAFPALLLIPAYAFLAWLVRYLRKTAPEGAVPKEARAA